MPGGRPKKYTKKYLAELVASLDEYVESMEIPILKEWCLSAGVPSNHVYDYPEFSESIKACVDKKEVGTERALERGDIPPAFGIFRLKQLGWSDKQELAHSGELDSTLRIEVIRADHPSD